MAGIPVNNNLNAFSHAVSRSAGAQGSQNMPGGNTSYAAKQEDALKDSFDTVMSRVNSQTKTPSAAQNARTQNAAKSQSAATSSAGSLTMSSNATAESVKQNTVQSEKATDSEGTKTVENKADDKVSDAELRDEASDTDVIEEATANGVSEKQKDAVTEAGEKLVEDIAEEMGVTPEEVLEAMEMLGLGVMQLLDPDNMKQLLVAISGNEDPLSIITDGELYLHFQNLMNTVSGSLKELQAELGLSEDELKALIAELAETENAPETAEVAEQLTAGAEPEKAEVPEGM